MLMDIAAMGMSWIARQHADGRRRELGNPAFDFESTLMAYKTSDITSLCLAWYATIGPLADALRHFFG